VTAPASAITVGKLSPSDRPVWEALFHAYNVFYESRYPQEVAAWAAERGCGRVYWHTHETNATARLLYDKLASLPGFIMYNMDLP
jgi:hypothetical protein